MAKGRKPTPTVIKLVTGNPGKRPIERDSMSPAVEVPEPNKKLSKAARAIWDETMPELKKLGVIAKVDKFQLEMYCNLVARARALQEFLDDPEVGYTFETLGKNGRMIRSRPEVKILENAEKQIRQYAEQWGMTASSRSRVKTDPRQGTLPLDDPTAGY